MVCLLLAGSEVAWSPMRAAQTLPHIGQGKPWAGARRLRGGTFFASVSFLLGSFPLVLLDK